MCIALFSVYVALHDYLMEYSRTLIVQSTVLCGMFFVCVCVCGGGNGGCGWGTWGVV